MSEVTNAEPTPDRGLQFLREIDKIDKIGLDGVCKMLGEGLTDQSGAFNKGLGLDPIKVSMARLFFEPMPSEADNSQRLYEMQRRLGALSHIRSRIDLMCHLEEKVFENGETAWDRLLKMPKNGDETWGNGRRPANIAWALDDIVSAFRVLPTLRPTSVV